MTREIEHLLKEAHGQLRKHAFRLSNSGAEDPASDGFAYHIVTAALLDTADNFMPLSKEARAAVKNLRHF